MLFAAKRKQLGTPGVLRGIPQRNFVVQHNREGKRDGNAALNIEMSEQTLQTRNGATVLNGVGMHASWTETNTHTYWTPVAHIFGSLADILDINLANLGGALGRPIGHALGKLIKTVGPSIDEVLVIPLVFDDLVNEC